MLDIGFQELVVIFAVAVMVFGPKRLPELSRNFGRGVGQLKKALFDVKYELNKEMKILDEEAGIKNPLDEIPKWKKEALDAIYNGGELKPGGAQGPGEMTSVNPPVEAKDDDMDGPHRAESIEDQESVDNDSAAESSTSSSASDDTDNENLEGDV